MVSVFDVVAVCTLFGKDMHICTVTFLPRHGLGAGITGSGGEGTCAVWV